jgi:hypothetical protein
MAERPTGGSNDESKPRRLVYFWNPIPGGAEIVGEDPAEVERTLHQMFEAGANQHVELSSSDEDDEDYISAQEMDQMEQEAHRKVREKQTLTGRIKWAIKHRFDRD